MRFSLVDRILEISPGKSLRAIKSLSLAEEYLADHFPGFPVMPGVLMIESMVQSAAWLMRVTDDFAYSTVLLKQVRGVKFNNFVSPGQTLTVDVSVKKWQGHECTLDGQGTVDGAAAVQAKLTLERSRLADRHPDLARADEIQVGKLRELFHQLWPPAAVPT